MLPIPNRVRESGPRPDMGEAPPGRGLSGSRPVSRILSWTVIHLIRINRIGRLILETQRIDLLAVLDELEMKMRSRRVPRLADISDDLSLADVLPGT